MITQGLRSFSAGSLKILHRRVNALSVVKRCIFVHGQTTNVPLPQECASSKDDEDEQRGTFYLFNARNPRKVTLPMEHPIRTTYTTESDFLQDQLPPPDGDDGTGYFQQVSESPAVYIYNFTNTLQASEEKLSEIGIRTLKTDYSNILPRHRDMPPIPPFLLDDWKVVDTNLLTSLLSYMEKMPSPKSGSEFDTNLCNLYETLDIPTKMVNLRKFISMTPRQRERAVNSALIDYVQTFLPQDLVVDFHSKSTIPGFVPTIYSKSYQDMVVYHKKNYITKSGVHGAICHMYGEEEEDSDDHWTINGGTAEIKEGRGSRDSHEGQLYCNALKLAGDLTTMCVRERGIMPDNINIFGLLINISINLSTPYLLKIRFNEEVQFYKSRYRDTSECVRDMLQLLM